MRIARGCLRTFSRVTSALAYALLLVAPIVAHAQVTAPPQPTLNRSPAAWIGYMIMIVLLAMVIVVSLLPSKRGHQD